MLEGIPMMCVPLLEDPDKKTEQEYVPVYAGR